MKKVIFSTLFAAFAAFCLSSCMNGDYDATPTSNNGTANPLANSGGNGGTGGTGGSGTSGGGISGNYNVASYYTWSGTDPLSMKIDGTAYQATGVVSAIDVGGFISCTLSGAGKTVTINLPDDVSSGNIVTLSSSSITNISLKDGSSTYYSATGSGGAFYIVEKDATHVKGKFVANVKELSASGLKNLTEGYFNFTF